LPLQTPAPGTRIVAWAGDVFRIRLETDPDAGGSAWLRTNIGHAEEMRSEITGRVERNDPIRGTDWHDLPMRRTGPGKFEAAIPLAQTGRFEAKAWFQPAPDSDPVWPEGGNVVIKVEPPETCAGISVYTAFIRQFGSNLSRRRSQPPGPVEAAASTLEAEGWTVIPPSGTFRSFMKHLDHIICVLGFRYIHLLPIFPTPTTYGRMGRFGSPFAATDLTAVDPALADFDRKATPMDQFVELLDAIHARSGKALLDVPINHTGWASELQLHHPDWFVHDPDGSFHSPEVWGVRWEDLSELDYSRAELWQHMAEVFLFWCRKGVDGFRCDAGYRIPLPVWRYIVAKVRSSFPDTIFLLEGLGGSWNTVEMLLDEGNLDWAYSELFQDIDGRHLATTLPHYIRISGARGILVHFAETHDNNRLAARSHLHARMRTALAALCSHNGAFGIANGVEWFAAEKIDVHQACALNWGSTANQVEHIRILNSLLANHRAFTAGASLQVVPQEKSNAIALIRRAADGSSPLLVAVNLDDESHAIVEWPAGVFADPARPLHDLLSRREITPSRSGDSASLNLAPAEVVCLSPSNEDAAVLQAALGGRSGCMPPDACRHQRLRAKVLEIMCAMTGPRDVSGADLDRLAQSLAADPRATVAGIAGRGCPPLVVWTWPSDARRAVMWLPGHFLMVAADSPFRAEICQGERTLRREESIASAGGSHFALIAHPKNLSPPAGLEIRLSVFTKQGAAKTTGTLFVPPDARTYAVKREFSGSEIRKRELRGLLANRIGAAVQMPAAWGLLMSRYDALLAANLSDRYPEDRHIMFARLRAWVNRKSYSAELRPEDITRFAAQHDSLEWDFILGVGDSRLICLRVAAWLASGRNLVMLRFSRQPAPAGENWLPDREPVRLIMRPDIEDRNHHHVTKAYLGPEASWPAAVSAHPDSFEFAPDKARRLVVSVNKGAFFSAPEWQYMVHRQTDAERGQDPNSDLFSPGYFTVVLRGGEDTLLSAEVFASDASGQAPPLPDSKPAVSKPGNKLHEAAAQALDCFIARRACGRTVIAGYPWFLDWGRDSLIAVRGLVAVGMMDEAASILAEIASHERGGTLPNMLAGPQPGNRDTSDAPLWLCVAAAEMAEASRQADFLDTFQAADGRLLRNILLSIGRSYAGGTSNGIRMDPESALVFSPAHFTWMDTQHPAGTPREGFPVEIQALWHRALLLLGRIEPSGPWSGLAQRARASFRSLFDSPEKPWAADCILAPPGCPARRGTPDWSLRPNQLFAVTLGLADEPRLARKIVAACEELVVPGAMRSLADRPATTPLAIFHQGRMLGDPNHPYRGRYEGDEDASRKPAYHNGTAWTWLLPVYAEALLAACGAEAKDAVFSLLGSAATLFEQGCAGHLPEILDGDYPHTMRGCWAQAWSASELARVLAFAEKFV